MDDIEFLKWLCEKAEWFKFDPDYDDRAIQYANEPCCSPEELGGRYHEFTLKVLLQSAIEGVNRDYHLAISNLRVNQDSMAIRVKYGGVFVYESYVADNPDKAKESALEYICIAEQERNNNEK